MKPFMIRLILFLAVSGAVGLAWPAAALIPEEPLHQKPAVNQSVAESGGVRYELIADEFAYGFEDTARITARITNISGGPKSFPWPCRDYFSARIKNGDTLIQNLNSESCDPNNELSILPDGGVLEYKYEWTLPGGGDTAVFATYTVDAFPIEPSIQSETPVNITFSNLSRTVCEIEDHLDKHIGHLQLSIWTQKRIYVKGEPISVFVEMKNIDSKTLYILYSPPFMDIIIYKDFTQAWRYIDGYVFIRAAIELYINGGDSRLDDAVDKYSYYNYPLEIHKNGIKMQIMDIGIGSYEVSFLAFNCAEKPIVKFEIVEE